jgi:hypothetical protein
MIIHSKKIITLGFATAFWKSLLPVLAGCLILLTSCQPKTKRHTQEGAGSQPVNETPIPPPSDIDADGGMDAGGGNGLKGRPLESYRVEIFVLPKLNLRLLDLLQKLEIKHEALAGDLMYIWKERNWYLVPVELEKLRAAKVGTYFGTDQIALQNLREVWINSEFFEKMNISTQIQLLVHEAVMGIRLLEFANSFNHCVLEKSNQLLPKYREQNGAGVYSEQKKHCAKKYKDNVLDQLTGDLARKKIKLSDEDYMSIRDLTYMLTHQLDALTNEDLENWLAVNPFRRYLK